MSVEDITAVELSEREWFADRLPLPDGLELGGES
jgi:hypothetical protein